jgi:hypothetical protein
MRNSKRASVNWAGEDEDVDTMVANAGPRASRSLRMGGFGKSTGHTGHELHVRKCQRRNELRGMEDGNRAITNGGPNVSSGASRAALRRQRKNKGRKLKVLGSENGLQGRTECKAKKDSIIEKESIVPERIERQTNPKKNTTRTNSPSKNIEKKLSKKERSRARFLAASAAKKLRDAENSAEIIPLAKESNVNDSEEITKVEEAEDEYEYDRKSESMNDVFLDNEDEGGVYADLEELNSINVSFAIRCAKTAPKRRDP